MNFKDKCERIPPPKNQAQIKFIRDPSKPDWSGLTFEDPPGETAPERVSDPKSSSDKARS